MDLLSTIHKSGSRGGRDSFKWSDVANSTHRENYLGHSIMAPVGRWQKGRDLSWYAKDRDSPADSIEDEDELHRREEIREVKGKEQAIMAAALGYAPAMPNIAEAGSARRAVDQKEVQRVIKATGDVESDEGKLMDEPTRGLGHGHYEDSNAFRGGFEKLDGNQDDYDRSSRDRRKVRRERIETNSRTRGKDWEGHRRRRSHSKDEKYERRKRHRRDYADYNPDLGENRQTRDTRTDEYHNRRYRDYERHRGSYDRHEGDNERWRRRSYSPENRSERRERDFHDRERRRRH